MNSTTLAFNKSEHIPKNKLSLNYFDSKIEDHSKERPPVITKVCDIFITRYPYHVQRNDLYELSGGRGWPNVLGALHWIVCSAMYAKNFVLELSYFEVFDAATANIAKCKWNFIFDSISPEYKDKAIEDLNNDLKQIEIGIRSDADPIQLKNIVSEKHAQSSELEKHKSEGIKLSEKIASLRAQISKIDESSSAMVNYIAIFREKSNKLDGELKIEEATKHKLSTRLTEIKDIVKNQPIDAGAVSSLSNQMQLSRRRINEYIDNCDIAKSEHAHLETEIREINFKIEDLVSVLLKKLNALRSEIASCDINFYSSSFPEFSVSDWQTEESEFKFKEFLNETKKKLNDTIKDVFTKKSKLEKEHCDKNMDLLGLNDHKNELGNKVNEIVSHYKMSEQNARDMMTEIIGSNEDSMLKLS
ncbi:hypothetical protein HZS_5515, partial [Henneguya salminicola]